NIGPRVVEQFSFHRQASCVGRPRWQTEGNRMIWYEAWSLGSTCNKAVYHINGPEQPASHLLFSRRKIDFGRDLVVQSQSDHHSHTARCSRLAYDRCEISTTRTKSHIGPFSAIMGKKGLRKQEESLKTID